MPKVKPVVHALLLADQITVDQGKWNILGVFEYLWTFEFPTTLQPFFIFCAVSSLRGPTEIQVSIRADDADSDDLFHASQRASIDDPTAVYDLSFCVPRLTLPEPGPYTVTLHADGDFLLSRPFKLMQAERE
ncbi:MAG: hypothetical protein EA378_04720 [Phycisphaerales bacterium]|nr:MAG: hypothetical protein EA378_04720 [Phycisphaerales bacterium]